MYRSALALTLSAILLVACGQQQAAATPTETQASTPVMSAVADDRSADRTVFVQECTASWPKSQQTAAVQQYCDCMADYVMNKYDAETYRRIDDAIRSQQSNAETEAFMADLNDNGLKACPAPVAE